MKNILFIIGFSFISFTGFSQTIAGAMSVSNDTLVNADTSYLKPNALNASRWITVQLNVTKITGTTAGTAAVQLSEDNVNWFPVTATGVDTLTISNASISKRWEIGVPKSRYYRVRVYSTGTTNSQKVTGTFYAQ